MNINTDENSMKEKKGLEKKIVGSRFFNRAKEQAAEFAKDPEKLNSLLKKADEKARLRKRGALDEVWVSLMTLFRMLRAYGSGAYRRIPVKTLIAMISSIIYFVMPFDFIPDILLMFGFMDDAALIAWTVKSIKKDIDQFAVWEADQTQKRDVSV
jgi:uncharacterized membrane protein YkvA (DUF1232 family)